MKFMQKNYLAIAVAGATVLGNASLQAADFSASTTLQSSLEVTVLQELEIGTVFATATGTALTDGVGAFKIDPALGTADSVSTADVKLTSLGGVTPAQGSVAVVGPFVLTVEHDTSTVLEAEFDDGTGAALANIETTGVALVHESANPAVPNLYMVHFTVSDVSGGVVDGGDQGGTAAANDGVFDVVMDFGETEYVFNIGATITTEPYVGTPAKEYQDGIYSGTFEVTAAY